MPVIQSPVKQFPGEVEIPDYLTYPQYIAYQDALQAAREREGAQQNAALLPGLLTCVTAWRVQGVPENPTAENFPATPPRAVSRLLAWLLVQIEAMIRDVDDSPNA